MKLLCIIGEPGAGGDKVSHIVDEMGGSGTVFALCGWKSKDYWRVGLREATNVPCKECCNKALGDAGPEGLFLNVPSDRYDVLRTMVSGTRTLVVVVPAELKPDERKKAIADLDSIAQALRKLD